MRGGNINLSFRNTPIRYSFSPYLLKIFELFTKIVYTFSILVLSQVILVHSLSSTKIY